MDLERFRPDPSRGNSSPTVFLFVGRMLWDKGVGDFVEAARLVKAERPELTPKFQLLGSVKSDNPQAIPEAQIREWETAGLVEYLGQVADVRPVMEKASVLVFPSRYREGVPRTLIEAAAMAIPIITTDNVGCRDMVDDGVNGYLVPPENPETLARALLRFLDLSAEERQTMGKAGREKAVREFDEKIVIDRYREELLKL